MKQEFRFTKSGINALQLPKNVNERVRYYDTTSRGLCLRLTSSGARSFTYYRKLNGRPFSLKLGNFPEMTVEQARGLTDELNGRYFHGHKLQDMANQKRCELRLKELFKIYIEKHAKAKRKTWAVMEKNFDRYIGGLKDKKLSEITPIMAETLHQRLRSTAGLYAANRTVQLLKAVYNKGIALKIYQGDNPFKSIELFLEKPRERFLSDIEVKRLLTVLDEEAGDDLRDFIKLSLFTGVRKSNLLSMKWSDIDFEHCRWVIPDTKNNTAHTIALGNRELEILLRRKEFGDCIDEEVLKKASEIYVFPGRGVTGHIVDLKKAWATVKHKADLDDCTIHDLRRSLAAAMANENVNIALVRGAMNHKDMKTTMAVYAKTNKTAELEARQKVQANWLD